MLLAREVAAGHRPACLAFDYGQRHRREIASSIDLASAYGCPWDVVAIPPATLAGSALTGGGPVPHGHYADPAQRATIVPNRNMVFLSIAAARAVALFGSVGGREVLIASHAGDAPIYPDCREVFFKAADRALWLGCGVNVRAPFVGMTKAEVVALGRSLGVDFGLTWSCYEGGKSPCGKCGACVERAEAMA